MRTPFIAGNWKMNNTPAQAKALLDELLPLVADATCRVAVCVPYICLPGVAAQLNGTKVLCGAQNLSQFESGAHTGEVSADMLTAVGTQCVIIGHSERRADDADTDARVNAKLKVALAHNLIPIVCVGESLAQREAGQTDALVRDQTLAALADIAAADVAKTVFAYEPIWAIGTGKTATADEAQRVCKLVRDTIATAFGQATADQVIVQYGGSMNAANCDELMAQPDIDGGLIGGASLKAADFARIVDSAK